MTHYPHSLNDGHHVFVFGSNLAGRHGKGAALTAKQHWGAVTGVGQGPEGQSFAIPTKDANLHTLPLNEIAFYVQVFKDYAKAMQDEIFLVTAIGTGLAGYSHDQIAPLFRDAPDNCVLPEEWK